MSLVQALTDWLKGEADEPQPSYSLRVFSCDDRVLASCQLKVKEYKLGWPTIVLESIHPAQARLTGIAQFAVLRRDGVPVAFMLADELFSTVEFDTGDSVVVQHLQFQLGTSTVRVLP